VEEEEALHVGRIVATPPRAIGIHPEPMDTDRAGTVETAPLRGRPGELAALERALDAVGRRECRFFFVGGEPGIGKSRLLEELSGRAEARDYLVFAGRAAEFEREVPFAAWVDALDAYVGSLDEARLGRMGVEHLEELGEIFPSLSRSGPGGIEEDRYRAHRAVRQLLDGLASTRPLVVALDDLHWADDASLELIATLARRPPERGVLIAGAHRPADTVEWLRAALVGLSDEAVIDLGPLPAGEAEALLPDELPLAQRGALLEEAGGNPFYILQLARSPAAVGQAGSAEVLEGGFAVPAAVSAALEQELAAVPDQTRTLLRGAAVAGEPFEVALAAAGAGLELPAALEALDQALAVGLVRPTRVPGQFLFRHPLVRRALYEGAPEGFRLGAHSRVAAALTERGGDAAASAHHVARSAQPGDTEAVATLVAAADRHRSRAPASSAAWYGAAVRLAEAAPAEQRAELLTRQADALLAAGRLEDSYEVMVAAQELASGDPSVDAVVLLAEIEQWLGRPDDAVARLHELDGRIGEDDPRASALIHFRLSYVHQWNGRLMPALEHTQAALEAARRAGDDVVLAAAEATMGERASHVDVPVARDFLERAAQRLEQADEEEVGFVLTALYSLGWGNVHLERYDQALSHFGHGLDLARRTGGQRFVYTLQTEPVETLNRMGRVREALAISDDAIESARLHPSPRFLWWALWLRCSLQQHMGDLDALETTFGEVETTAARLPAQPMLDVWMGYMRARLHSMRGDHEAAVATLEAAGGGRDLPNIPPNDRSAAWEILVTAAIARGDLDEADRVAAEAEGWAQASGLRALAGHALRCRAWLEFAHGAADAAAEAAAKSVEAFEAVGTPLDSAISRIVQGDALAAAGRKEDAVEALRKAEQTLHELGCERYRAEAARALRKLGRRTPVRAGAAGGDEGVLSTLSAREREIADLVHRELTNREIAEELFLSEKTVQTHLRNIFAKLGVSSRVAVAVAVQQAREARDQPTP
jgi:ATP/maltotriose-dependent transcriptional regulator MalT